MPSDSHPIDAAAMNAIAARFASGGGQPGLAYGIVADGKLVHSGGCGERWLGGPVPDANTAFRIASMTKSFTATQILLLAAQGRLNLDDPAQLYVRELSGVPLPATDCPAPTIRHLLTMTAGFPSDDPWGDRQQGLEPAAFATLLADGGVRYAWAPGTRFEYSNLGYAVLGKVIETVTGLGYADAIRADILAPLALEQTGFTADEFYPSRLARGYQRDGAAWLELAPDPHGAFAPMGGIFSTVRDLATWVAGFAAAFPARSGPEHGHPLSRAARRQMQSPQVAISADGDAPLVRIGSGTAAISYGFGLFIEDDQEFGNVVQHSGGYPGYGSQMRWHPETGLGTIVLANGTYAWAGKLASELLAAALRAHAAAAASGNEGVLKARGPVPEPGPWPETLEAKAAIDRLLAEWDDGAAAGLFTVNVELDRPLSQRRAEVERLHERIGRFRPDPHRPIECDSPAHCRWWVTGERGTAAIQIRLAPLTQPLVQQLLVAVPPAAGSALHVALQALIAVMNDGAQQWPEVLTAADAVDRGEVLRQLRVAGAWAGSCQLDSYLAGNGDTTVTARLAGRSAPVLLTVEVGGTDGELRRAEVSLAR